MTDKGEVMGNITEVQAKLQAKKDEFHAVKEVEASISAEFFSTVPTGIVIECVCEWR